MLTIGFAVMLVYSATSVRVQSVLDEQRIAGHSKAEGEVDQSGKRKACEQRARRRPGRIAEGRTKLPEQIEKRDDRDQRGILEQPDEAVDETRNDVAERLRQHDQPGRLPPGQTERACRLGLSARD